MVSQVEIVAKEIIKPSDPTPYNLKHLKLSFLDRLEGLSYVPLVLFYRNQWSSGDDRAQRSQQLKQSLSETLNKFYPFAGRINGNGLVDCNDSGALFSEAIQSAGKNKDIINHYLPLDIAAEPHGNDDKSKYFPLAVQINFFQCGGIAIGLCVSHKLADMYTFATFMNAWAAKSSGSNETVRPDFHIGSDHFPPIDIPEDKLENPSAAHDLLPGEAKIVSKRFVFDAETLAGMKKHLVSSRSDTPNPTRVETVSAFIWKHLIDVTRAKNATKRTFGAFHMVDLRRRISPPVPDAMVLSLYLYCILLTIILTRTTLNLTFSSPFFDCNPRNITPQQFPFISFFFSVFCFLYLPTDSFCVLCLLFFSHHFSFFLSTTSCWGT